ncbi:hypothetical protein [Chitinophaga defluvii]|uniref:Uncharacterized protein n=1 Tax=Chitinophaga defluvii TaxID=3163343 RepID=A0ABV2TDG3_9BACT
MKKQRLHKILAYFLLSIFVFHTAPREFIHQFAGHDDTMDVHALPGTVSFSVPHTHCDFLQIEVAPFEPASYFYTAPIQQVAWIFAQPFMPVVKHIPYRDLSPRAPPAYLI